MNSYLVYDIAIESLKHIEREKREAETSSRPGREISSLENTENDEMSVITAGDISDEIEVIGVVSGNAVRAKDIGKDIISGLKRLVGGEVRKYPEMQADARDEVVNRLINDARKCDAEAVVNIRFSISQMNEKTAELLEYLTAVKVRKV